ncbi:hypothetical protein [Neoaquamicrobium sediminum]|uniref:hypothetical protein n=1 Tax=Neoaquamicrobium sediminum TaxID=1849104 RepID=UPI0015648CA0|nr:hypothetical protein [Mesorhizobium sediminum]NRC54249.1 hypothetical protein [Mesorhizobium sediminum]
MSASTTLGDFFRVRKEKGEAGLPTLSVTMNDGLVDRADLDRKMETNLAPEEHLRVREGDIAYNMMRMWQGAFGRAEKDGIVSPAYVVVEPRENMDSRFAAHWFKSARMIYLFWAYSYGLTQDRLRLYADDFCHIPAGPPSLPEQKELLKRSMPMTKRLRAKTLTLPLRNVNLAGSIRKYFPIPARPCRMAGRLSRLPVLQRFALAASTRNPLRAR